MTTPVPLTPQHLTFLQTVLQKVEAPVSAVEVLGNDIIAWVEHLVKGKSVASPAPPVPSSPVVQLPGVTVSPAPVVSPDGSVVLPTAAGAVIPPVKVSS